MAYQNFTPEELKTEEWRDVVGFERLYRVSSLGRIQSVHGKWTNWSGRFLQPNISGRRGRYPKVTLVKDGRHFYRRVHRLVAEAFIGKAPKGKPQVNHKDTDRSNNRYTNLEYCSQQGNIDHAKSNGRLRQGINHPQAKLTEDQVRFVRVSDLPAKAIAAILEVTTGAVYAIRSDSVWKHLN